MRPSLAWLVGFCIAVCPARGQENATQDDIDKGHQLAVTLCAICHLAAPDQALKPDSNPPAPSFQSIAQRKDIDVNYLRKFITTTHRGLDRPKGMPNLYLADYQVKQIIAYLLSLHK